MAKPKLDQLIIRPGKNGGHMVRHEFQPQAKLGKGALTGGMTMDRPPSSEVNFGPNDHHNLLKHIATALALKGLAQNAPGQPGEQAPAGEEQPQV
jgi:hypothetical protein